MGEDSKKVLVVDDEKVVRICCERTLCDTDYGLLTVDTPEEGLRVLKEKGEDFGVVLTDLKMPGMDGLEFIRQAQSIAPHIRLVLVSGFATDEVRDQAGELGIEFLAKPFGPKELLEVLERASVAE